MGLTIGTGRVILIRAISLSHQIFLDSYFQIVLIALRASSTHPLPNH